MFKDRNIDSSYKGESFVSNDFKRYQPPVLDKTERDTINYIVSAMLLCRIVDLYIDKTTVNYNQYCYVNAGVFDDYIIRQKKKIETDDSTSISAQIVADSLHIYRHSIKKDSIPTLLVGKIKYRKLGSIYLTDNFFYKEYVNYDYLSLIDSSVYSVFEVTDTTDKKRTTKKMYEIQKLIVNSESVTSMALPVFADSAENIKADSILSTIGLTVKDHSIVYEEAKLTALFRSTLAVGKFDLQRLKNFPNDKKNILEKQYVWYVAVIVILFTLIFFLRRRRIDNNLK